MSREQFKEYVYWCFHMLYCHMLEVHGCPHFREGPAHHLDTFKYSNASNGNYVMHICFYLFFFSSDLLSGQLNFIPNIENVIFWFKLYSVSWDYWWDYLNKFISEDLWASLSHASSKPVADAMETWTKQMGYPVLFVTAKQVCVYQYFALDLFSARGFPLITRE